MMCVSRKLSPTPASPPADYAPPPASSSIQRLRQTGTTSSTFAISPPLPPTLLPPPPPPSRQHHNHRSRRRSRRAKGCRTRRRNTAPSSVDEDQRRGPTTTTGRRDGRTEKGLDERKGSDEAADTAQGVPPTWWRTGDRKRDYNRYAALSSTEEDADPESQEYGSAGYGVCIGGRRGGLALRRLKNCDKLDEGLRILLEQDSGINTGSDALDFLAEKQYVDAADADGWKEAGSRMMKMAPPRLDDFTFSLPSRLTGTIMTPATTGMATTRTWIKTAADPEVASFPNPLTLSANSRYGNKAVALSPPPSGAAPSSFVTSLLDLFRGNGGEGKELAEQILFSSLAGNEEEELIHFLDKASRPVPPPLALLHDSSSSSSPPTTLIGGSERRRSGVTKTSRVFSPLGDFSGDCGDGDGDGEDSKPKVAVAEEEAGWLEFIVMPPRFEFGNGKGKVEVVIAFVSVGAAAGVRDGNGDEEAGKKRGVGDDLFADHGEEEEEEEGLLVKLFKGIEIGGGRDDGREKEEEEEEEEEEEGEDLFVELFREIEIESENGREGNDELGEESEIGGGSWVWDVINRVEAL